MLVGNSASATASKRRDKIFSSSNLTQPISKEFKLKIHIAATCSKPYFISSYKKRNKQHVANMPTLGSRYNKSAIYF